MPTWQSCQHLWYDYSYYYPETPILCEKCEAWREPASDEVHPPKRLEITHA